MNKIPKIYTFGTRFNTDILRGPVAVEEKIDGSQFQFGLDLEEGVLVCRSKGQVIDLNAPGMFSAAVETALGFGDVLVPGRVYQCEYLAKPKHNVLSYNRIPRSHLVLFDAKDKDGTYLSLDAKRASADILGLEPVPVLHFGELSPTQEWVDAFLQTDSALGGCKVEGIVIKNYALPHPESESGFAPMTAKIVSERFKEKQSSQPRNPKAGQGEHMQAIINSLRTEARWLKAIQHLREAGQLANAEKDIGPLVREIQRDTLEEEADWIKEQLFVAAKTEIHRGVVQGFAQYYKSLLNNGMSVYQEMVTAPAAQ
jgi:hypothetical protein